MSININCKKSVLKRNIRMCDMPQNSVGVITRAPIGHGEVGRVITRDEFFRIVCIHPVIVAYGEDIGEYEVELWNHVEINIKLS